MTAVSDTPSRALPGADHETRVIHGPIMAAARASSIEETRDLSAYVDTTIVITLPAVSTDPLDELVDRVRPTVARAVDALQVAAVLEAQGVSDRQARVEYGFDDVFRLAEEVYRRLGPFPPEEATAVPAAPDRARAILEVFHGPLYLLPSAIFPAVLVLVGRRSLVMGVVLAGGLAWVLAAGSSWLAYRLLGAGYPGRAGRVLRWSALAGPAFGAALGGVVVFVTGSGPWLIALATGQLAYQMASTLLMFYRRELLLLPAMAPAVVAGVAYLVVGAPLLPWAAGIGAVSTVVAFAIGLRLTTGDAPAGEPSVRRAVGADLPTLPWVTAYAALSATFLLHAQMPYLLGQADVALAAAPLIIGMGIVEWRARRFGERARALPPLLRLPRQFVTRVWLYVAGDVAACMLAVAAIGVPVLVLIEWWRSVTAAAVAMTAAYAVLAGAYHLAFLLAERSRYGSLCAALGLAVGLHLGARLLLAGPTLDPLTDALAYLASALLLQALFISALAPVLGQVWRYR